MVKAPTSVEINDYGGVNRVLINDHNMIIINPWFGVRGAVSSGGQGETHSHVYSILCVMLVLRTHMEGTIDQHLWIYAW